MALVRGRGRNAPPRLPPPRAPSGSAYARRKAAAERLRGKPWAEFSAEEKRIARGHAREREEKQARRKRIKAQFGVTPEKLSQLRKAVTAHMRSELGQVGFSARHRPDFDVIPENIKGLSGEGLSLMLEYDRDDIRGLAKLPYEELLQSHPEFENDEGRNPFWYH